MTDDNLVTMLQSQGYWAVRRLPDGRYIGVMRMLFTWDVFVGLDEFGYAYRYFYRYEYEARAAADAFDGIHDPPGPWIACKGLGEDRYGPGSRSGAHLEPPR